MDIDIWTFVALMGGMGVGVLLSYRSHRRRKRRFEVAMKKIKANIEVGAPLTGTLDELRDIRGLLVAMLELAVTNGDDRMEGVLRAQLTIVDLETSFRDNVREV